MTLVVISREELLSRRWIPISHQAHTHLKPVEEILRAPMPETRANMHDVYVPLWVSIVIDVAGYKLALRYVEHGLRTPGWPERVEAVWRLGGGSAVQFLPEFVERGRVL